jgi:hypothetical protein
MFVGVISITNIRDIPHGSRPWPRGPYVIDSSTNLNQQIYVRFFYIMSVLAASSVGEPKKQA